MRGLLGSHLALHERPLFQHAVRLYEEKPPLAASLRAITEVLTDGYCLSSVFVQLASVRSG
jgi:hypothetical protein